MRIFFPASVLLLAVALLSGCSSTQLKPGPSQIVSTSNPLVAEYRITPPQAGYVLVEYGSTTKYGRYTNPVAIATDGSQTSVLVAGLRGNTTYHMRAILQYSNGDVVEDEDHTFTTSNFDSARIPSVTATTSEGRSPQPGVELVNATASTVPNYLQAYALDLAGNLIWAYDYADRQANTIIQPIKLLSNGHFILVIGYPSENLVNGLPASNQLVTLREIDLAGNTVRELKLADLNQRMQNAGYNLTLYNLHHDVALLPNGHFILIASIRKSFTDLTGYPGTTNAVGDALIDLDQDWNVSWVWNEFDHLDINRHPMNFPDWTHTNAVLYSQSDSDLIVSIPHQNWIVKVDYNNGTGTGNILWKLGAEGDFALKKGTDPTDWFYNQHEPAFLTQTTSGKLTLAVMDNGNDRSFPSGTVCDSAGQPACHYSTIPVYDIDEKAKTATLSFHQILGASDYSSSGGTTTALSNGNLEYDLAALPNGGARVQEVTLDSTPKLIWQLTTPNQTLYRANRVSSLYPGVQW